MEYSSILLDTKINEKYYRKTQGIFSSGRITRKRRSSVLLRKAIEYPATVYDPMALER